MATYTTEIASDKLISDNPIHQRLLKAYIAAQPWISGKLLEIGCGEGRGVEILLPHASEYLGIDKIQEVIDELRKKFPKVNFGQAVIPPFQGIEDNSYDTVV
ncbi:methyltransferase domain-containing protein, partial [Algoriphagus sp.]|uniref:class I SAM-dependent methyltransferase n=1 Tax=Algoriphagus sp. TaxID=1872435 RepID=UPI0025D48BDE